MRKTSALAALIVFAWSPPAAAYCVKNATRTSLRFRVFVDQPVCRAGSEDYDHADCEAAKQRRFTRRLEPGERACCDWRDPDCNPAGKGRTKLTFLAETGALQDAYRACSHAARADADLQLREFSLRDDKEIARRMAEYDEETAVWRRRAEAAKEGGAKRRKAERMVERRDRRRASHERRLRKVAQCRWAKQL